MIDLHHIPARHDTINLRLEQWARWVAVRPQPWKMQPMFRLYKAPPQWEPRELKVEINTIEAHEIEKMVSQLPDKHRSAIRWAYVYSYIHPGPIQRKLGVTIPELETLINNARDMLKNRLQQRMKDHG
mgnify:CR=1 FL=1